MKWQWFLGGRIMFWVATIILVLFIFIYVTTFVFDPTAFIFMKKQSVDESSIKEISERYVQSLGVIVNKPVCYRFVKYQHEEWFKPHNKSDTVLLGTFHEWNGTYYIDISIDLYKMTMLYDVVIHETRHMLVQELKNEEIIDLSDYTEEIAQKKNKIYNNLFNSGINLLKEEQTLTDTMVTNHNITDGE